MIPFHSPQPLSHSHITLHSYSPQSIKGRALELEIQALLQKGAIEPASPSSGYYSRMFVVTKAPGGWRPIIDLSALNHFVVKTLFKMETTQSVLRSICRCDWMVSVDLKDAYLQVPGHPSSRKFLQFVAWGKTWQFRVLCFGLTTAPQVSTRVMAPVSAFLHRLGIRVLRYLDDWLILAANRDEAIRARDTVLDLCVDLGIIVNLEKSALNPSQVVSYLGVRIDSQTFRALPYPSRIEKFFSIVEEFLSSRGQSTKFWRVLLGHLASLIHLVPGGCLRVRSLQLCLRTHWDFLDESQIIRWDASSQEDLVWWCEEGRLEEGVSLEFRHSGLMFWSDASDQGWGATACDQVASGCWDVDEVGLSINVKELLVIEKGLHVFLPFLKGQSVAVFSDNTTALSYIWHQGGTLS